MAVAYPVQKLLERCPSAFGRHIHAHHLHSWLFDRYVSIAALQRIPVVGRPRR